MMSLHSDLPSEYFVDVVGSHFHTRVPRVYMLVRVSYICVCVYVCIFASGVAIIGNNTAP